jgi:hypothetical protein
MVVSTMVMLLPSMLFYIKNLIYFIVNITLDLNLQLCNIYHGPIHNHNRFLITTWLFLISVLLAVAV